MTETVRITDVAPRDGLQNEPGVVPTGGKSRLVRAIEQSGVAEVEVSSFVSPKWVPQLADAGDLFAELAATKREGVVYSALVPNTRGMQRLVELNAGRAHKLVDKAAVFTAASETFSERNTNATIAETLERFEPVVATAREHGVRLRGYVSCAIACPYEGPVEPGRVAEVASDLAGLGVDEIDLGDTIGAGTARTVAEMLLAVVEALGGRRLSDHGEPFVTLHLHDTFGRAAECVREALAIGVRSFDGSAGGLGGCPFAATGGRPAPGNIQTDLLVRTIEEEGFETGIDRGRLAHASAIAERLVSAARLEAGAGG